MTSPLNAVEVAQFGVQQLKSIQAAPATADVAHFQGLLGAGQQQGSAVADLVSKAEHQLLKVEMDIGSKLRKFNSNNDILELVNAMHESSMRSVSIQLTGRVGSKSAESFEQLVKQQ